MRAVRQLAFAALLLLAAGTQAQQQQRPAAGGSAAPARPAASATPATPAPAAAAAATQQQAPRPAQTAPKAGAADPKGSLHEVLAKNAPAVRGLLDVLAIKPADVPAGAIGTFFAPSDAAVAAHLQATGLSAAELRAKPSLVDMMLAYHFLPGRALTASDAAAGPRVAASGDEQYLLRLRSAGGKLVVGDVQGADARVAAGPLAAGGISVYVINRVLASGNYFTSIEAALGFPHAWITAASLVKKAGLAAELARAGPLTLFVPDNAAFKPTEAVTARASASRIAEILRYHAIGSGARQIPAGFRNATGLATLLKGHALSTAIAERGAPVPFAARGTTVAVPQLTITAETGRPAVVIAYNIWAGNSVLHGIDQLLQPAGLPPDAGAIPMNVSIIPPEIVAAAAAAQLQAEAEEAALVEGTPMEPEERPLAVAAEAGPRRQRAAPTPGSGRRLQQQQQQQQQVPGLAEPTSVAPAGSVGYTQSFPNGLAPTSLRAALRAAAGAVPLAVERRFATLPASGADGGCLNCRAWAAAAL